MEDTRNVVRQRKTQHGGSPIQTSKEGEIHPTSKTAGWTLLAQLSFTVISLPLVYIIYVHFFVPDIAEARQLNLGQPPPLTGPLAVNNILQQGERLFEDEVLGPESMVYDKGHIYAGTADGKIVHIENGKLRVLTTLGKPPCGLLENEHTCGRPLGMRLDKDGYLIVLDAYLGLFKVNTVTGDFVRYFSSDILIDGESPKFLNDLDIAEDGTIYFTDTSTKWSRRFYTYSILGGDNTGRLVKYDPKSNTTEVLVKGLYFPNGVQLSSGQDFLIFSETVLSRIWKYHLKGSKKGHLEIFIDNLPGMPDNIRRSKIVPGFWVPLPLCRHEGGLNMLDIVAPYPWIRSFIMKAFSPKVLMALGSTHCGRVLQVDTDGKIIRSLHDPAGNTLHTISEIEEGKDELYVGSFKAPFLGKLNLRKIVE